MARRLSRQALLSRGKETPEGNGNSEAEMNYTNALHRGFENAKLNQLQAVQHDSLDLGAIRD